MNRRHFGLVILTLVAVATTGMLYPVLGNHLAAGNTEEVGVSVVDTAISETEEGTILTATLRIQNPTTRPLVVPETVAYGELGIQAKGATLNRRRVTEIDRSRIPARGTGTARFRFVLKDEYADRIANLLDEARLSGQIPFQLDGTTIKTEIDVALSGGGD
ncbi:MAG: hypothetical protein ABEI99_09315 [Halobaculum sp.]